jgi:hypothetical protein
MKSEMLNAPVTVARVATLDEIRAAISPFCDSLEDEASDFLCEIATDAGGYVRITDVERETSRLVDELTREQETWTN